MRRFVISCLIACLMLSTGLARAKQRIEAVTYGQTGGMNTSRPMTLLQEGEASLLQNVEFRDRQIWTMRKGYAAICDTIYGYPTVLEIVPYVKANGIDYLCVLDGDSLYQVVSYADSFESAGALSRASGTFDFETFNDTLIIARSDSTLLKFGGSTVDTMGTSAPTDIRCLRAYRNYLFAGSASTTTASRLYFSELGDPGTWNTSTWFIDVAKGDGSWITGLAVVGDRLLVFKRHGTYQLVGYSTDTFEVSPLLMGIGCVNHRTIQEVGDAVIWQGEKKIYLMGIAGLEEISKPIRATLDSANADFASQSLYYPKASQYWITMDMDSDDTTDAVLVYDLEGERWSKFTGMEFSALGIATVDGAELPRKAVAGGYDKGVVYQLDYGTSDPGGTIAYELDTGEFDCGMPFVTKRFHWVYVWTEVDTVSTRPLLDFLIDGTAISTDDTLTAAIADHLYPIKQNLSRSGRVIQFKLKHTGATGGKLHVGAFSIGFVPEGAFR